MSSLKLLDPLQTIILPKRPPVIESQQNFIKLVNLFVFFHTNRMIFQLYCISRDSAKLQIMEILRIYDNFPR